MRVYYLDMSKHIEFDVIISPTGRVLSPIMGTFRDREAAQMRLNRLTRRNRGAATIRYFRTVAESATDATKI